ncbi:hypothetical protein QTL97_16235 [Sporosarcina thermotolerans]|uniref:Uncharacterized protein n=1 Tax=Sporosarcina thermotolerans TaxID=633404 RepID=A0AAW9AEF0_9BACL|nr:hypothetical protein [Sporosarcina thermotolerans]MDW0118480.1 hypothetical protein [Sporosarcina thermotolerans]WHT47737.1 hypothetical protein QNH10_16690 [Sporosarcina thermotolerans]
MIGMNLFPILLLYGLPSSVLSDFVTKKLKGIGRVGAALVIHLILATAFIMIIHRNEEGWEPMKFLLLLSLLSSFLFWSVDELLKIYKAKQIRMKNGDLKIH